MKDRLLKNASSSIIQFLVNSVVLFVFYKFLLKTIGPRDIGIWSLVLGISSLTQIAAFGFAGGAVKYVSKYLARQEENKVSIVIQTSLISVGLFVGVFILLGYPLFRIFILNAVGAENAFKAQQILPFGMICLWLATLVGVVFSSMDGYQKIYLRNYVSMGISITNLLLCFIVVPKFRLLGLAYLSLFQNTMILIICWSLLRNSNRLLPIIPKQWDKEIFREVIGYNANFQFISFMNMFFEPTTKYFLSKFGGVASVGYYEMASKLATQIRGVMTSGNQALLPVIANYAESNMEKVRGVYINSFQLLLFIILPAYCFLLLAVPLISQLWIGSLNGIFMLALFALSITNTMNILCNPAYFSNLGTGYLKDILIANIGMAISNLLLAYILGILWQGNGVIIAWSLTSFVGALYVFVSYNNRHKISIDDMLSAYFSKFVIFIIAVFSAGEFLLWLNGNHLWGRILILFIVAAGLLYHQCRHPYFSKIMDWVAQKGLKS